MMEDDLTPDRPRQDIPEEEIELRRQEVLAKVSPSKLFGRSRAMAGGKPPSVLVRFHSLEDREAVKEAAHKAGMSLNAYCLKMLKKGVV